METNWEDKNINSKRKIRQSKYALELVQNPVIIRVNALENLNTQHPEYRPLINAEENIIYFTSRRPGGSSEVKDDQDNYYEDIYYSEKINNKWTKPSLALGELNIEKSSSALYLSADGEYMFISQW